MEVRLALVFGSDEPALCNTKSAISGCAESPWKVAPLAFASSTRWPPTCAADPATLAHLIETTAACASAGMAAAAAAPDLAAGEGGHQARSSVPSSRWTMRSFPMCSVATSIGEVTMVLHFQFTETATGERFVDGDLKAFESALAERGMTYEDLVDAGIKLNQI